MDQTIINWLLVGFGGLISFVLKSLWEAVKDLQKADKQLIDKVSSIEVLVAGQYMLKTDFNQNIGDLKTEFTNTMGAVFRKLDKIDDKIDKKADKQ